MEHSQFIEKLWSRSGDGVGFISSLDRNTGEWSDVPYNWDDKAEYIQEEGVDIFFSPLTFSKPRRLATLHLPPSILFADLDPVDPRGLLDLTPNCAWATSQGSYQGVWYLEEPIKYSTKWADLNRRMTYHVQADLGGWAASKVLRVPGSINYKRGGEVGEVLWWDVGTPFSYDWLDKVLVPSEEIRSPQEVGEAPTIIRNRKELDLIWKKLPARVQWLLTRSKVSDRSRFIVSTAHVMRELGVEAEDAYHMLWYAPYNKWRIRNNPNRLWTEIHHVYHG